MRIKGEIGKTRIKHPCSICGKIIEKTSSKVCRKCYYKSLKGSGNPMFGRNNAKKYYCIDCNKEINHGYKRCHKCAAKNNWIYSEQLKNRNMSGKNNPNYIDGRSFEPYTIEFNEELKESIRNRDNYTCQNCSMSEEEHLIVYGQVLHIHHIDYNKKNCEDDNLMTLCNSCNTRANFNRDYWKELYMEKINHVSYK